MVAPFWGPITQIGPASGPLSYEKVSYGQTRPYDINLPYQLRIGQATGPNNWSDGWRWRAFAESITTDDAYSKAYGRLVDQLGDPASLGITLVQWRQADAMIKNRGSQLLQFSNALVRRSPIGVAAALGLRLKDCQAIMRTRYGVARKLSDLWLEFWFGWKPAVQDIYAACEVFDRDLPWGLYKGSATITTKPKDPIQVPGTPWSEGIMFEFVQSRVKVGVEVRVANPNVRLLQQMGLINPFEIAFDGIPWSFVLGWFSNVSTWLSSFTDFAGLETRNGYVSRTGKVLGQTYWPAYSHLGGKGHGASMSRVLVNQPPRPSFALNGISLKPARALTAITLLVQKLPR